VDALAIRTDIDGAGIRVVTLSVRVATGTQDDRRAEAAAVIVAIVLSARIVVVAIDRLTRTEALHAVCFITGVDGSAVFDRSTRNTTCVLIPGVDARARDCRAAVCGAVLAVVAILGRVATNSILTGRTLAEVIRSRAIRRAGASTARLGF